MSLLEDKKSQPIANVTVSSMSNAYVDKKNNIVERDHDDVLRLKMKKEQA